MFDRVLNAPIDEVRALPSDNIITKAILKNVSKVSTLLYSNNFIERKLQDRCFPVKFSCKVCKGCKGAAVHRCFSKWLVLKISQNSQETPALEFLFNKVAGR